MENLALARLKQAANKNKTNADNNGVHSSNLVSLTGSPGVKDRKVSGGGARSDMDVSDDDLCPEIDGKMLKLPMLSFRFYFLFFCDRFDSLLQEGCLESNRSKTNVLKGCWWRRTGADWEWK